MQERENPFKLERNHKEVINIKTRHFLNLFLACSKTRKRKK